jgi:hypothetical protein
MGMCVLYAVPKSSAVGMKGSGEQRLVHRLAKVDHFGVVTLVSSPWERRAFREVAKLSSS